MTALEDEKAGWCNMCRAGTHSLCGSAKCRCPKRGHDHRPSGSAPVGPAARASEGSEPTPINRAAAAKQAPPPDREKPVPVFRLVKEAPPEPRRKLSLVEQLQPLLDEIPDGDTDWWSIAQYPTSRGAAVNAAKCRKIAGDGWEWTASGARLFVRRAPGGDQ